MATMSARYTVIDGEVVAQERGGVRHQLVPDPLGSTVALYDDAGTKTDTFSYWPYGESSSRLGVTSVNFQFVGCVGYYKDKSKLTYVRARYLYPNLGRWITEDPIGVYDGDYNLYRYVKNRIISFIDPTGNWPENAQYGNYCGPQDKVPVNKCKKPLPPKDDLDTCCEKHDYCFSLYKCTFWNQHFTAGCLTCNSKLCACLIETVEGCGILNLRPTLKCIAKRAAMSYACNPLNMDLNSPIPRISIY